MAYLAIQGHATRGNEVIALLKMLGGIDSGFFSGNETDRFYYIEVDKGICFIDDVVECLDFRKLTIEQFLKRFPYKIGDRVKNVYGDYGKVYEMKWIDDEIQYRLNFGHHISGWYGADELQPYKEETMDNANKVMLEANAQCCDIMNHLIKEETMKENLEQITLDIPDGYEFYGINYDNKVVLTKKQPQCPKTYEECCKVLGICPNGDIVYAGNWTYGGEYLEEHLERIRNFQKLLICCDAYWKIAGEQMGWSEPWKPDWKSLDKKYNIYNYRGVISHDCFTVIDRCVLVFPTEEMRDAFYENFKDLIEECKDLLQ